MASQGPGMVTSKRPGLVDGPGLGDFRGIRAGERSPMTPTLTLPLPYSPFTSTPISKWQARPTMMTSLHSPTTHHSHHIYRTRCTHRSHHNHNTRTQVRISRSFDGKGPLGTARFLLPLLLDIQLNKLLPALFTPPMLRALQANFKCRVVSRSCKFSQQPW